ncbi:MAG: ABC transporter permease [Candidatus Aquicultorales bacterium]
MKLYVIFKQSLKAIFANKGRSFLTTLGIVIGISSVIALIALGTGVKTNIAGRISALGSTTLTVMPGAGFGGGDSQEGVGGHPRPGGGGGPVAGSTSTLTSKDLESLVESDKHPSIKLVSGNISGSAVFDTKEGQRRYTVLGTSETYFEIQGFDINTGAAYDSDDLTDNKKAIVLGNELANDLFGKTDPVGKALRIQEDDYEVVAVLAKADESGFNNPNSQAFVPYTAARQTFKTENFSSITVRANDEESVTLAKKEIQKTLLANHKISDAKLADFNVNSAADLLSTMSSITSIMTSLLAGIAAISLVVGGIGIMNIMLVSVTERTREIGLRKAVGAKTLDIMGQFVVEAVLLTLTGGLFGIALGSFVARIAARMIGFEPIVTADAVLLAVGVSSIVGLVFGIYPAAKAARLNPIDALRYE